MGQGDDLDTSQFSLLIHTTVSKMMLNLKVVKIDSKIIILLCFFASVTRSCIINIKSVQNNKKASFSTGVDN